MKGTDIAIIGGVLIAAYFAIQYFGGKSITSTGNSLGAALSSGIGSTVTGIGSGLFKNVINPSSPIAMQQNNDIRTALNLPPDTQQTLYFPFTNIPISSQQQNNDIRSFFGLTPENNNVQYFPFTNIPIGRTA